MKVDHLYVLPILASYDTETDKKLETLNTATALFRRHAGKSRSAALIEISNLWGLRFDSEVKMTHGENPPLGPGIGGTAGQLRRSREGAPGSPRSISPQTALRNSLGSQDGPKDASLAREQGGRATVGFYLVFHSDGGGAVLDPESVAHIIASVIPEELRPGVTKISLFACDIANQGEGSKSLDDIFGMTVEEMQRRTKLIGGLQIMVGLMTDLAKLGIRPMICGYDIPVFAGDGPMKKGQSSRSVKKLEKGAWAETKYADPDVYGRKLVLYKDGRQSLGPLKDRNSVENDFRQRHKKVLRLDDQGRIANALAGWSSGAK